MKVLENISLASYTSWLVGGLADYLVLPESEEELNQAVLWAKEKKLPITILGGGSNVLVSDKGIRGLTICLRRFSGLTHSEKEGRLVITALSGTGKSDLLKVFLKYKLPPALFLAGLPGDVGGGIVMNAGVAENFLPREFHELVDSFDVLDLNSSKLENKHYKKSDIHWSYRHSMGWQPGIIVKAQLSWLLSDVDSQILDKVKEANKTRLAKQPLDLPSCGSVFINPEGYKAAQLIDQSGLKGFSIGAAMVSPKHANFIVNVGQAKALDIWNLILHVQKVVIEKKGVKLQTEVVRLGEW